MLLVCLLIFFLPFIASEDFEEITYRKFKSVEVAREEIGKIMKHAKDKTVNAYSPAILVGCNSTDPLQKFGVFADFGYLENFLVINAKFVNTHNRVVDDKKNLHTALLHAEVRTEDQHFSFDFWKFKEEHEESDMRWQLYRAENLKCGLPKKSYIQERLEVAQKVYAKHDYYGDWFGILRLMFSFDSHFQFCDGKVEKQYFFHDENTEPGYLRTRDVNKPEIDPQPVVVHDVIEFRRDHERPRQHSTFTTPVAFYQIDATIYGRRMLLEYDDDWKEFTKGREYPCDGEKVLNWE